MAAEPSSRLGVYTWESGSDQFSRAQMNASHNALEDKATGFVQGPIEDRPEASLAVKGFFHFDANKVLSYCDGSQWHDVSTASALAGSTVADLDSSAGTVGSLDTLARSDHRHGIATDAITENMIQNDAVTRDKISNNSVDLTKLVDSASGYAVLGKTGSGSGDFAEITAGANTVLRRTASGNLSFGTLSAAHIGNGQITTDKIGAGQVTFDKMAANSVGTEQYKDGSIKAEHFAPGAVESASLGEDSIDSLNIVSGAIDTRHFADNQVTVGKIQQVGGHSILARLGSTTDNLSELAAGANGVLYRSGTNPLAFATLGANQITNGVITDAKLSSMGANTVKARASTTGAPQNISIGQNQVLGRIGTGALAGVQVSAGMIANNAIDSDQYVDGSINGEHLNSNLYSTSTATWQGNLTGNAATASTAAEIAITNTSTSNQEYYLCFVDGTTTSTQARKDTALQYNPYLNRIGAQSFVGTDATCGTFNGSIFKSSVGGTGTNGAAFTGKSFTGGTFSGTTVVATGDIETGGVLKCDSLQWNDNSGGTGQNKFLDSGGGTLMGLWQSGGFTHFELPPGLPTLTGMSDVGINNNSKQIGIISSSKRFKHSIEPATLEQLNNIIDGLEVDFFRWNDDILENSGRPLDSEPELGMIAEKVGAAFSCATIYDENDIPLGWQKAPVVSLCVGLLKEHKDQLAAMETRLAALEA